MTQQRPSPSPTWDLVDTEDMLVNSLSKSPDSQRSCQRFLRHSKLSRIVLADDGLCRGSQFPCFDDGDVKFILDSRHQYVLHSIVLINTSSLFRTLLTTEPAPRLSNSSMRHGNLTHYVRPFHHPYLKDPYDACFIQLKCFSPSGTAERHGEAFNDLGSSRTVSSTLPASYSIVPKIGPEWHQFSSI